MRIALALMALVLAAGCGGSSGSEPVADTTPAAIEGVETFSGLSHDHLYTGQYPHAYPQSPPVGGAHSPAWLACGVYTKDVPKENAVHSIEHGGIWITYQPGYKDIGPLVASAQLNPQYVLVSPYTGQDSPVIVTTWGLQLRLQTSEDPRLIAFIQKYAGGGQGGEKGATCATGGLTPEQAAAFDAQK
jgi:hypothetical protein